MVIQSLLLVSKISRKVKGMMVGLISKIWRLILFIGVKLIIEWTIW